jgi:SAM-dependent methyltransferase
MDHDDSLRLIDACAERVTADDPEVDAWVSHYHRNHRLRLAEDLRMVCQFANPGAVIIEFGAIPPILTLALKIACFDIRGVDIAPERFGAMIERESLHVAKCDFEVERVPFDDESADMVLFNEVFEHMRIDLIRTMSEVSRVLKPGGRLLLSTPNLRSLRGLLSLVLHHRSCHVCPDLYAEYSKLTRFGHMGHVREYTVKEVRTFLSHIGLETAQTLYRNHRPAGHRNIFGKTRDALEAACYLVTPSLKPMFSLVCRKHGHPE